MDGGGGGGGGGGRSGGCAVICLKALGVIHDRGTPFVAAGMDGTLMVVNEPEIYIDVEEPLQINALENHHVSLASVATTTEDCCNDRGYCSFFIWWGGRGEGRV